MSQPMITRLDELPQSEVSSDEMYEHEEEEVMEKSFKEQFNEENFLLFLFFYVASSQVIHDLLRKGGFDEFKLPIIVSIIMLIVWVFTKVFILKKIK